MSKEEVLIIKHGALGDIVLATGPMLAIRTHHPDANITVLTTKPYAKLLAQAPFIDEVWIDEKPKAWQLKQLCQLVKVLNGRGFSWVYDLQTSSRSTRYFKLFTSPKPNCSGLAKGASHRHNTPERTSLHTIDRQKQQLAIAGIESVPAPNLDWLKADISDIKPEGDYALLVPGGSPHRPEKRWPAASFIELANKLKAQSIQPVLIGTKAEADLLSEIEQAVCGLSNLCDKTSLEQLPELARDAKLAVGNDTGPMHIIAAAGCPSTVLFDVNASNPDLCAPRGGHVTIMKSQDLSGVKPDSVWPLLALN